MAARPAWQFGAGRIIVIDDHDFRREFVARHAPAEVDDARQTDDVAVFVKKLTGDLGADIGIEAVGGDAQGSALCG